MEENLIGERIRELRKQKNLTQDDLAVLINSSRVQINQWETGARELSASRIIEFASALDTSCDYLLRGVPTEKSDSFNQTGLDLNSLNALSDIMNLSEHKKKQYLSIINGILGSDYFWHSVMPHLLAALSIKENAALGGAYAGLRDFNFDLLSDKLQESINTLTFSNTAGYTDHILINRDAAVAFQLQEGSEAFKLLLKAIIEKYDTNKNDLLLNFTAPYRRKNSADEKISTSEFLDYIKAMGITIDNAKIRKE